MVYAQLCFFEFGHLPSVIYFLFWGRLCVLCCLLCNAVCVTNLPETELIARGVYWDWDPVELDEKLQRRVVFLCSGEWSDMKLPRQRKAVFISMRSFMLLMQHSVTHLLLSFTVS